MDRVSVKFSALLVLGTFCFAQAIYAGTTCIQEASQKLAQVQSSKRGVRTGAAFDYLKFALYQTSSEYRLPKEEELVQKYKNDSEFAMWLDTQKPGRPAEMLLSEYSKLEPGRLITAKDQALVRPRVVRLDDYAGETEWEGNRKIRLFEKVKKKWDIAGRKYDENQLWVEVMNRLSFDPEIKNQEFFETTDHLNAYEAKVLRLRQGDVVTFARRSVSFEEVRESPQKSLTVEGKVVTLADFREKSYLFFGQQSFKLGKYLGAGNATHIFEIEGKPDQVLKIPFEVRDLKKDRKKRSVPFHPEYLNQIFSERVPLKYINRAQIIEKGYGYTVVSRIWGTENGQRFLRRIFDQLKITDDDRLGIYVDSFLKQSRDKLNAEDYKKTEKLLNSIEELKPAILGKIILTEDPERQFIWEPGWNSGEGRWVLVDFE